MRSMRCIVCFCWSEILSKEAVVYFLFTTEKGITEKLDSPSTLVANATLFTIPITKLPNHGVLEETWIDLDITWGSRFHKHFWFFAFCRTIWCRDIDVIDSLEFYMHWHKKTVPDRKRKQLLTRWRLTIHLFLRHNTFCYWSCRKISENHPYQRLKIKDNPYKLLAPLIRCTADTYG